MSPKLVLFLWILALGTSRALPVNKTGEVLDEKVETIPIQEMTPENLKMQLDIVVGKIDNSMTLLTQVLDDLVEYQKQNHQSNDKEKHDTYKNWYVEIAMLGTSIIFLVVAFALACSRWGLFEDKEMKEFKFMAQKSGQWYYFNGRGVMSKVEKAKFAEPEKKPTYFILNPTCPKCEPSSSPPQPPMDIPTPTTPTFSFSVDWLKNKQSTENK